MSDPGPPTLLDVPAHFDVSDAATSCLKLKDERP
jgi:hypothetical protein